MDKTTLVAEQIEAGRQLLDGIKREGLPVSSALWLREPDERVWRLYISTSDASRYGPRTVYEKILKVLKRQKLQIALDDVRVVSPANTTVEIIRSPHTQVVNTITTTQSGDALIYGTQKKSGS